MRYSLLFPLIFLGLAGCVVANPAPAPTSTTYVTPAPTTSTTYATPTSSTTVVRTP